MPDKKISPEPAEDEYTLKAKIRQVLRLHKDARAGTRILDVDFLKNPPSSMRFRLNVDEPNEELVRTSPSAVCWPICTGRIGLETPLTKDHKAGEIFRYEPILEARGMNNPYLAYVPWNDRKACCYTKPAPCCCLTFDATPVLATVPKEELEKKVLATTCMICHSCSKPKDVYPDEHTCLSKCCAGCCRSCNASCMVIDECKLACCTVACPCCGPKGCDCGSGALCSPAGCCDPKTCQFCGPGTACAGPDGKCCGPQGKCCGPTGCVKCAFCQGFDFTFCGPNGCCYLQHGQCCGPCFSTCGPEGKCCGPKGKYKCDACCGDAGTCCDTSGNCEAGPCKGRNCTPCIECATCEFGKLCRGCGGGGSCKCGGIDCGPCGGGKCCGIDFGTCGGGICAVLCCGLCGDGEGAYQTVGMNICGGCCHVTCVKCPNALAGYGSPERLVISKEGACDIDKMPGAPTPEAMERGT